MLKAAINTRWDRPFGLSLPRLCRVTDSSYPSRDRRNRYSYAKESKVGGPSSWAAPQRYAHLRMGAYQPSGFHPTHEAFLKPWASTRGRSPAGPRLQALRALP